MDNLFSNKTLLYSIVTGVVLTVILIVVLVVVLGAKTSIGKEKFLVSVGHPTSNNSIAYSTDSGKNWQLNDQSIFTTGTSVCKLSDTWLATGLGDNSVAYSKDGMKWFPLGKLLNSGLCCASNGEVALIGGEKTTNGFSLLKTTDGIEYKPFSQDNGNILHIVTSIATNGKIWLVAGLKPKNTAPFNLSYSTTPLNTDAAIITNIKLLKNINTENFTTAMIYSTDLKTWTEIPVSTEFKTQINSLCYFNKTWVAACPTSSDKTTESIFTCELSSNVIIPTTWTPVVGSNKLFTDGLALSLATNGKKLLISGLGISASGKGMNSIYYSTDIRNWLPVIYPLPLFVVNKLEYSDNWTAVGASPIKLTDMSQISISSNGIENWSETSKLFSVAYDVCSS